MRKLKIAGPALLILVAGFVWGFFAHRNAIFPHSLLVRAGAATGVLEAVSPRAAGYGYDALSGLPYVDGTFDQNAEAAGVVEHDPERSAPGLNFYGSRRSASALLIDAEGEIVHTWAYPSGSWEHTELLANGDILASVLDNRLMRLDLDSELLWVVSGRFHHDLEVLPNGDILALVRAAELIPEVHSRVKTLDDRLLLLSAEGEKKREVSLTRVLLESPYAFLVPVMEHRPLAADGSSGKERELDVLHANHVEVFDGSLAARSSLFAAGNALVSFRNINTIAILDSALERVLWVWGPSDLTYQHHPVLLASGRILLFDNGRRESRVIEVDPLSRSVDWCFDNGEEFFSRTRGSVQRLANGNTLITESDRGYAFEVTPGGETVWRFANPDISEEGRRIAIWRMMRFRREELPFLDRLRPK